MIDTRWIGHELAPSVLPIERTRLRFFAKATGQTDPIYLERAAARAAGHADIPAPPTFLFAADYDSGAFYRLFSDMGVPLANLLHAEQGFTYHRLVYVGDTVTVRTRVADIYSKKGGALEFICLASRVTGPHDDQLVAELHTVLVWRH
ncbi:MaoC family dehydratase N-terminal domain-containing protein [Castellaniella sp.]|uniref:MaoC family dehydratase N-terminal domain-containing protein n=1 Tax=Castellaniella sp. TaxID=1955812 RepID=UPI00355F4CCA